MGPAEDDVRAANEAFYEAFRKRDANGMGVLWAKNAPVACMHPGMKPLVGREAVLRSWRGILAHPQAPSLGCSEVEVHVLGTSAFVTCLEGTEGDGPRLAATNVFIHEDGRWRLVHHQAGPLSPAHVGKGKKSRGQGKGGGSEPEPDPTVWN